MGHMDGLVDGHRDGLVNGHMDGPIKGHRQLNNCFNSFRAH